MGMGRKHMHGSQEAASVLFMGELGGRDFFIRFMYIQDCMALTSLAAM